MPARRRPPTAVARATVVALLPALCAAAGCGGRRATGGPAPRPQGGTSIGATAAAPSAVASAPAPAPCEDAPDEAPFAAPRPAGERPFVEYTPAARDELARTKPKVDARFGAVTCRAGHDVWKDAAGRLRVCTVAREASVGGVAIAEGAYSHFHANGAPHQTHLARGAALATGAGEAVPCAAKELVVLDEAGKLTYCTLARTATFAGVPAKAGEGVAFHPGGELAAATLAAPLAAAGVTFGAGTRLAWRPDGGVAGGWFAAPAALGPYRVRDDFTLHRDGSPRRITLAEPAAVRGRAFEAFAVVELRPDGSLRAAEFVAEHGFMPHGEPWEDRTRARYDCAGAVVSSDTTHWQAQDSPASFRRREERRKGKLARGAHRFRARGTAPDVGQGFVASAPLPNRSK